MASDCVGVFDGVYFFAAISALWPDVVDIAAFYNDRVWILDG